MVPTRARSLGATPTEDADLGEPGPAIDRADPPTDSIPPRRGAGLLIVIGALAFAAWPGATLWMILAAGAVALSVGLPLVVADSSRAAERLVPVLVVALALVSGWAAYARASGPGEMRDRAHDGGVLVTRAAAEDVVALRNPYASDFSDALPASWEQVQGADGSKIDNPVTQHFPYLPAAAWMQAPFVGAADALGLEWDPRILGWLAMVAAMVVIARRPEPAWLRLGAIAGIGGPLSIVYLSWGTNDVLAASLLVLSLAAAVDRRPRLAGVVLALALSTKVLLAVVVPPLALAVVLAGGWAALKRWWTLPATLVATCLPYLLWGPADLLDDTVWFNLGRSETEFPISGIGLPAAHPDLVAGPLLALVTLLGLVAALVLPLLAVRRWPSIWTAGAAAGAALLFVLIPARTFQVNYLVLIATLVPLAWLAFAELTSGAPARSGEPDA